MVGRFHKLEIARSMCIVQRTEKIMAKAAEKERESRKYIDILVFVAEKLRQQKSSTKHKHITYSQLFKPNKSNAQTRCVQDCRPKKMKLT